ncbi:MAG: S8 family serine peptidase [Lachnospiraceae bacterium]|nr:S8 family serine peptidase [Lachnospiraceae bacterium]
MKKYICIMLAIVIFSCILFISKGANNKMSANPVVQLNEDNIDGYCIVEQEAEKIAVSIEYDDKYDEGYIQKKIYQELDEYEDIKKILDNGGELNLEQMQIVRKIRIQIVENYVQQKRKEFLDNANISEESIVSACKLIPYIPVVMLTPEQITALKENELVISVNYVDLNEKVVSYANEAIQVIDGYIGVNNGYIGNGIKVGVIDAAHPNVGIMGNEGTNIMCTNEGNVGIHSTMVCGIIKKMVPGVTIYSRAVTMITEIVPAIEYLIEEQEVSVINMSCGKLSSDGNFNEYSRGIDELVYRSKCTICIAAGNPENVTQTIDNMYINQFGLAPNAITVGAVTRVGNDTSEQGTYVTNLYSMYREGVTAVNKPDVCAPGNVTIYGYTSEGTSFSTPLVVGTVAQMISRNPGMEDKPETIKAALMASAARNAGSNMSYVNNSIVSNYEGAGVIDTEFCYYVARNGRRTDISISETGAQYVNVYCDTVNRKFRVAIAWYVNSDTITETTLKTDIDMRIYKNDILVDSSIAPANSVTQNIANTNYEIISLDEDVLNEFGAGYYTIRINTVGNLNGPIPNIVGVAWEQIR